MDARDLAAQIDYLPYDAEVTSGENPTVTFHDDDGVEQRVFLVRILCDLCNGNGTHVNPGIDSNGITGEEMHELGDEFRENYSSGVYDVVCARCKGDRWIFEVDRKRSPAAGIAAFDEHIQWQYDSAAEQEAERRMGA